MLFLTKLFCPKSCFVPRYFVHMLFCPHAILSSAQMSAAILSDAHLSGHHKSWFDLYCFSFSLTSLFQSKNEVSLNTTKFIENSVRINYSFCVRNRQIGYLKVPTFYTLAAVHAPYLLGQAKMTFYHLTCDIPRLNIE